ncbi:hypothetical protein GJAV_G00101050 [Gymnothorax javanicus]|nr:hypothetical protein GJAV_G00101050 [Gymnothorax javanicus]
MEDQERQKKLEAGKAKLAEYRQRKAEAGGQKKSKKKKKNAGKQGAGKNQHTEERDPSLGEERTRHRANTPTSEYTFSRKLHSGETVKHDQTFTIEPESEVSTTAEDYSSEEENLGSPESHHDDEAGDLHLRLQMAEDELAEKQRNMEELTKELEEIRAAFSTELQNFEAAINQRDDIITQLTTNLQLARKEKDDIMREFQEMTDQSQKLQIQFQQLQAGETLRNSSHSSTAADLLQARVQITSIQQQVEQRETEAKVHLEKIDELQLQVTQLQHSLNQSETLGRTQEEHFLQRLNEKDKLITEQKRIMTEHESLLTILKNDLEDTKKSLNDSKEQISEQSQELERCRGELSSSKQREQVSSSEIRLLMGTVEDLQKRSHKGSQSESDLVRRLELDMERKMDRLRAELDEIHGQQIVQMKRELQMQHSLETDRLMERDKSELELLRAQSTTNLNEMNALNMKIAELTQNIEEVQTLKMKLERELLCTSEEKLNLLGQVEDLKRELCSFRRADEGSLSITNQEKRQAEIQRLEATVSRLEAHLAAVEEANRDLESKHESEITNYKIKLEMLEREKDAVLSMMAESQEAELEKLRTQMLFSHEEELATLRADLQKESTLQLENLKDEMTLKQKHTLHNMQKSLQEQLQVMKSEKENLAAEKLALLNKIKVLEEYLSRPSDSTCTGESAAQREESQLKMEGIGQEDKENGANLSKRDTVVEIRDVRRKARKLHPKNVILQEGAETIKVERKRMLEETKCSTRQGEMRNLTVESEQLSNEQMETDKIEKQRSTFFKVNNEQLNEEFACLLKTKSKLKEEILMVTMQYEVKLSNLQLEIQKLLKCKAQPCKLQVDNGEADKMEQDLTDGSKLIGENVAELTAPHQAVHGDESGLSLSPSEVSAQLVLKDNEVARAMEDEQCITAATGERDEQREVVMGTASLERTNAQQPAVMAFSSSTLSGGSRLIRDRNRRTESSGERGSALESAEGERSHTQQLCSTQRLEQQALHDQAQVRRQTHRAESAGLGSQEDGDALQQPLDALGLAAPAGESLCADAEQKELDLATAAQEIQALKERLRMLHAPRSEENGASQQSVTLRQEEFQLQFEALRISLSQICAAQLELQKEHLQAEREACLRRQEQELHATHAHEMQQLCEKHQQELQGLRGQHSGPKETQSEEMDGLKTYYREQQIQLEERHNQEMERLRADYQQQAKCTEERYTTEIIMLKRRLQDLAMSRALLRPSSFSREPQFSAPKVEEGAEYKRRAELECLAADRGRELQAVEEENFPSAESHHDSVNGGVWSTEGHEAVELIQALERQHQERVEEEIAKVIVQMSIEFAQQTELTRIAEQSRETMSVQKADVEPGGAEEFQLNETSPDNQALPRGDGEVSGLEFLPKMTKVTTQYTEKEEEGNSKSYQGNEDNSGSLPPVIRPDASPDIITNERNLLRQANQSLRQVLSDVLKTTAAAEETIGRYVEGFLDVSLGTKLAAVDSSLSAGAGGDALPDSCHGSKAECDDVSMWSEGMETDEGLTSSLLTGAEPQLEKEEYLMNISSRLQAAVEKLLVAITKTANQVRGHKVASRGRERADLLREVNSWGEYEWVSRVC